MHGSVVAVVALSLNVGKARDETQRLQADLAQHIVVDIVIQSQVHLLNPGALILEVLEAASAVTHHRANLKKEYSSVSPRCKS
uniref:Uncharacterized protein n=1 Tax=Hyaloperonospora arabidopsidis (strain Emoy2) TaxID=559515 RepID=M4C1C6_HYAAE